jgi:hypothetical protein
MEEEIVRICAFVKVERSQVRVSHFLANFVRTEHRTAEEVFQLLDHDRIVIPPVE